MRCIVVGAGITGLAVARELQARGHAAIVLERTGIGCRRLRRAAGRRAAAVGNDGRLPPRCRVGRVLARGDRASRLARPARAAQRAAISSWRSHDPRSNGSRRTSASRTPRGSLRGWSSRTRRPSSCPACGPTRSSAAPGAARTATSTGRRRSSRRSRTASTCDTSTCALFARTAQGGASRESTPTRLSSQRAPRRRPLLAPLGIDVPVEAEDRYLFFSDPIAERLLEPLVVAPELAFATKQLADGRVLASDLSARAEMRRRDRRRGEQRSAPGSSCCVPRLEHVSFSLLVRGVYDVSPDHQPILGEVARRACTWRAASAATVS